MSGGLPLFLVATRRAAMRTTKEPIGTHKRCAIYTRLSVGTGLDQELNSLEVQR